MYAFLAVLPGALKGNLVNRATLGLHSSSSQPGTVTKTVSGGNEADGLEKPKSKKSSKYLGNLIESASKASERGS